MHWLPPGIGINFAFGTFMLLFGLLVLWVRNRKMETRIPYTFYASPVLGTLGPEPANHPAQRLRRATNRVQHSGLLLSTGLKYTPRENGNSKAPENSANQLAAPLVFPAPQISADAKMNSAFPPFENLTSITLAEIPAFAQQIGRAHV